jgi:hypothetical protein
VDWALLASSINVSHFKTVFVKEVVELSLKCLESGEVEAFRRASFFILLLMQLNHLDEIILAS